MLFPDVERDLDYADHQMSEYEFLKRCQRTACQRVRELLEGWFQRYPEPDSGELRSRFRSGDDPHFRSSFWELYLHELLLRFDYSVEVHPKLDTEEDTSPDFLAARPEGEDIVVEATSTEKDTEEPDAATRRKEVVLDTINRLSHQDFILHLESRGATRNWPKRPPSGSGVRSQLKKWLDGLDYESLRSELEEEGLDAMPTLDFDLEGWKVRFTAVPRSREKRSAEREKIIGYRSPGAQWVDTSTPIRDRIRDKATRYGDVQRPYLIAVSMSDTGLDTIDLMDALFGDEVLQVSVSDREEPEYTFGRKPKGAWVGPQGEINTRVSAVLIGVGASPWRVARAPLILCHNPWAKQPLEGPITSLPEYVPEEGDYENKEGVHPRSVFDLPPGWPGPQS